MLSAVFLGSVFLLLCCGTLQRPGECRRPARFLQDILRFYRVDGQENCREGKKEQCAAKRKVMDQRIRADVSLGKACNDNACDDGGFGGFQTKPYKQGEEANTDDSGGADQYVEVKFIVAQRDASGSCRFGKQEDAIGK